MKWFLCFLSLLWQFDVFAEVLLVVNKSSHSVSLLDPQDPDYQIAIGVGFEPHEVAVSENGRWAVVTNYGGGMRPGGSVAVIDVNNKSLKSTIFLDHGARPHGVKFASSDTVLVTAEGVQSLYWIKIDEDRVLKKLKLPGEGAHLLAVDSAIQYAYVANKESGTLAKVNLSEWKVEFETKIGNGTEGIALLERTNRLILTSRKDNKVSIYDAISLKEIRTLKTDRGPIRALAFDNEEKTVITNSVSGTVQILDNQKLEIIRTFKSSNTYSLTNGEKFGGFFGALPVPVTPYVDEATNTLYVANSFAGNIAQMDLETGKIIRSFETQKQPDGLAMSQLSLPFPKKEKTPHCKSAAIQYDTPIHSDMTSAWALLTDFASYENWNPWVFKLKGPLSEGGILKAKVKMGSINVSTDHEITKIIAPHTFCWKDVSWFAKFGSGSRCRHLEMREGVLHLQNRFEYEGALQTVIDFFMRTAIEDGMASENAAFKAALEGKQ